MPQKVIVDFELQAKNAEKNIKKLQDQVADLQKKVEEANSKTEKGVSKIGKAAKGAASGVKKVGSTIGNLAKFAGVLFILQKAFEFISEAVKSNQTVMDALTTATETAQIIFNQVADTIFRNSENFDALGRIMSNLLTIALTPIKLSFNAIKAALLGAQLAWEQSWLGGNDPERIKELKAELNGVKEDVISIGTDAIGAASGIVNDFGEAISEVSNIAKVTTEALSTENIKAATETAKANKQLRKDAELARVANQGLIEQYDIQAEQQRQIRDNDLKSIDDRIKANNDLKAILTNQKEAMLENAQAILDAAEAQFKLTGLDEDNIALQEAKNELKAVEAQITGFMSEQESNRVALLKEKMELEASDTEATAARQAEQRAFNAEMMENDMARLQQLKDDLEEEKRIETERLTAKRDSYEKGTQAFIDANNELLDFQQANGNEQVKIDKQINQKKQELVTNALGNLASIVGKNSKFGKAIAVVQAIRDTFAGANTALKASPPPFNFIAAAAVVAAGIANVKSITSTKEPPAPSFAKGGTGGAATPTPPPTPSPVMPDISSVGDSGLNQLASAIGDQSQQPIQAFVVSNDVTTAQGLERNIVDGASI
tara:strand:+ start:7562 stop:9373 length:1812 start_codon:yes stop_codon:yes gene_type:complete